MTSEWYFGQISSQHNSVSTVLTHYVRPTNPRNVCFRRMPDHSVSETFRQKGILWLFLAESHVLVWSQQKVPQGRWSAANHQICRRKYTDFYQTGGKWFFCWLGHLKMSFYYPSSHRGQQGGGVIYFLCFNLWSHLCQPFLKQWWLWGTITYRWEMFVYDLGELLYLEGGEDSYWLLVKQIYQVVAFVVVCRINL